MKLLEKILPKQVTVEEIHEAFDTAQDRILQKCDKILTELKIPTETQLEKKADILQELGFINSEPVKQAKSLKEVSQNIQKTIDLTRKQAETIQYFKAKYPFEKFITTEELDRICEKYNLIHAPVANYIKDIPEKNVLEMKNCKKLDREDKQTDYFLVTEVSDKGDFNKFLNILGKTKPEFTNEEVVKSMIEYRTYIGSNILNEWIFGTDSDHMVFYDIKEKLGLKFRIEKYQKISKSGLFIAAPKSHFNLENLTKKSKFGFFNVEIKEVKDPIVFEYCKDGIVRIISKWGTEDDKSYLDPIVQNEILN